MTLMEQAIAGTTQGLGHAAELFRCRARLQRVAPFRSRRGTARVASSSQEVKTAERAEAAAVQEQEVKTGERSEAAAVQEQETEPEVVAEPEAEAETEAEEAPAESGEVVVNEQGEEIYLGFDKGDTTPRTGRKGRTIVDDAERYPSRSELVGGWAGGEVGLQQFVEAAEEAGEVPGTDAAAQKGDPKPAKAAAKGGKAKPAAEDPAKYPSKDSIGPFSGVTGGFAGGERGVQQYVEQGDIQLAPPGRGRQFSPLIIAGGVALVASLGGLLLDDGVKLGEEAVESGGMPGVDLAVAPIDDSTKLALQAGIALLGVVGVGLGVRALVRQVQEGTGRLAEKALDLGKVSLFWIAVFLAAKYVLESS